MAKSKRRPIKLVFTEDRDMSAVTGGGGPPREFKDVDEQFRKKLTDNLFNIQSVFSNELEKQRLPVVARAVLENEALAKSYRPDSIFSANTCPIIGMDKLGTLLISVTHEGLGRLIDKIQSGTTQQQTADISTIVEITPYTEDFKHRDEIDTYESGEHTLKIRVFNHDDSELNDKINGAFNRLIKDTNERIKVKQVSYASGVLVYKISGLSASEVKKFAKFVGTQSVGVFPQFALSTQYNHVDDLSDASFPPPESEADYPIVGIIDSGTDPGNDKLQAWVEARDEEDVPANDQDNRHGSFVAGLIANGKALNHDAAGFPDCQAKIVDVVAIPKNSPIDEDDLLGTIRRVVKKFPNVQVWNLSISAVTQTCQDNSVSEFAMALDELQSENEILFVNCAGNLSHGSPRPWPAVPASEYDRIYSPGDSARSLTVGSIAHISNNASVVKEGEPSPFSRRGPGASFMPKPEVCHFGGNCDHNFGYAQTGVLSVGSGASRSEAIGTSFSTPLITTTVGSLLHASDEELTINMAKALVIHSAALDSGKSTTAANLKYRGFGKPGKVKDLLECESWRATLLFEPEIPVDRRIFSKLDFPVPDCFRTESGGIKGGFLLTAVYDPPLSSTGGFDYCQANVEVSLGSFDSKDPNSDPVHSRIVPVQPKDYSKLGERNMVRHGFKWSPVKVFQHEFREKAVDRVRLFVRLYLRSNEVGIETQNVAIVASMYDPKRELPVYDQTVQKLQTGGWQTSNVQLRAGVRQRLR